MNIISLSKNGNRARLRKLINQSIREITEKYRRDNKLLVQHYMSEQHRLNDVQDSIQYAKRLQDALFPTEKDLRELGSDSFIFNMPRDVLSGDFCWYHRSGCRLILSVADCTGHGIPGALMSVLGLSLLNQIVVEERNFEPSHILRRIDEKMRTSFMHSEELTRSSYDGMDMSVVVIDFNAGQLKFAGAMRPMWIMRKGKLLEFKGARYPIGGLRLEASRNYPGAETEIEAGDFIYLFTDGLTDQFGGPDDKKIGRERLRLLLHLIHDLPARNQKEQLMEFFLLWKGMEIQTDDVTMLGLRV
jgi:serine phosphatase RsbU (regulator of sigma subunit)